MPVPIRTEKPRKPHVSDIQRERAEMLATFEASSNLPLLVFARLAGKSRDQIPYLPPLASGVRVIANGDF